MLVGLIIIINIILYDISYLSILYKCKMPYADQCTEFVLIVAILLYLNVYSPPLSTKNKSNTIYEHRENICSYNIVFNIFIHLSEENYMSLVISTSKFYIVPYVMTSHLHRIVCFYSHISAMRT